MLKGLITSIFPPRRFARWSSCTLDGTCFDLSLHEIRRRERAAGLCGDSHTIGVLSSLWLAIFHVAGANQPKRSSSSSFFVFVTAPLAPPPPRRCVFVHHHPLSSPPSSFGLHLHLALSLFLSYVHTYVYTAHPLRDRSRKRVVGRPSHPVSAFLSRPCREKPLAPDAAYAENIAEVATHCPGVAVECSFADDGVISSYYTL